MGAKNSLILSSGLHFLTAGLIIAIGIMGDFNWLFWVGALIFFALLIYQHMIVKPDDLSRVNRAFGTTNGIASVIFAIFFIAAIYI
jgi:4-hydroxybenzoate polyprenyltransferase